MRPHRLNANVTHRASGFPHSRYASPVILMLEAQPELSQQH